MEIGGGRSDGGRFAAAEARGESRSSPPPTTAHGALLGHMTGGHVVPDEAPRDFQPMNINFGLFPPDRPAVVDEDGGNACAATKKRRRGSGRCPPRALRDFDAWLGESRRAAA